MDDIADTATPEPAIVHDPPSLPASPPGKRTRFIEPLPSDPLPPPLELPATHQPLQPDEALAAAIPALSSPTSARSMTAMASVPLKVKLLSKKGKAPERGSVGAAGYDIYSARSTTIPAKGQAVVDTDIAIAVPPGTYGRIAPRSGLAVKHGITTGAGVIDADYTGPVKVLLFNLGAEDYQVGQGERVAQLVLEVIFTPAVQVVSELDASVRGAGGFGSTGNFGLAASDGVVAAATASGAATPTPTAL